jgi:hypothetical protein
MQVCHLFSKSTIGTSHDIAGMKLRTCPYKLLQLGADMWIVRRNFAGLARFAAIPYHYEEIPGLYRPRWRHILAYRALRQTRIVSKGNFSFLEKLEDNTDPEGIRRAETG